MAERLTITIERIEQGYLVGCVELPELNLFVRNAESLTEAVPRAIRYLYLHNEDRTVKVMMEVPVLDSQELTQPVRREVQLKAA